ncbi:MAG TPA: flagellar hook-associated protein FlgK [Acetobacteraceae bacterium]|jgi:flagellar hook-associated protein 1 FlgK|nr:flagellar hook-associated protein FlgK [Acetobacteraceae bacterium]
MSIQGAMLIAASSLDMSQQQSDLIANNVANASTPGYVERELPQSELVAGGVGMGVVAGIVQRLGDAVAADAANQATGAQAYSQQMVNVLGSYVQNVGQPADSSSLPSVLSAFQQALTTLSSTPDSTTAQAQTVAAAQNVTSTFQSLDTAIAGAREQADQGIASDVTSVNETLDQFAQNEAQLQQAAARGDSTAPFEDTRANLLANLSQNLPIKVFQSDNNAVIVTTDQGTTLWDGSEHKLAFDASPSIGASQTAGLSPVTVDGAPIQMSQTGSIAADLQLRDGTLAGFANQLDQMAGNLITAFQQSDPSVAAGQTGVFTVAGAALDPTDPSAIPGLAGKIQVNASLDPTQGGQYWRIRDGAQATAQGPSGNNSTVLGFVNALQQPQSYDTTTGLPGSMTLSNAASQIAGVQQVALSTWTDNNTTRTQQMQAAQSTLSNATGVNVDDEMQRLLLVQHTYEASAQVLQAAAKMLDALNALN